MLRAEIRAWESIQAREFGARFSARCIVIAGAASDRASDIDFCRDYASACDAYAEAGLRVEVEALAARRDKQKRQGRT